QEFVSPAMPPMPGTPGLMVGRFYAQLSAKYRSIETFRFDGRPDQVTGNIIPLTVPFGPTVAGNFGVGTANVGFTGNNGPVGDPLSWTYDNGRVSGDVIPPGPTTPVVPVNPAGGTSPPNSPNPGAGLLFPGIPTACTQANEAPPPANVGLTCNGDTQWIYSVSTPELGRYFGTISGTATCCDGLQAASSTGSFSIVDPTIQVNNFGGPMSGTTTVRFDVAGNDLNFTMDATTFGNREFGTKAWSIGFETGFQLYDYFDIFYGLSFFSASNSLTFNNTVLGSASSTTIEDTFPFFSDDTTNWIAANFNSSETIINGNAFHNYHLSTNNTLRGIFPNRQFIRQTLDFFPTENVTEVLTNRADIWVCDSRFGTRSWIPLYGLGRFGAQLGFAFMPANYTISGTRTYTGDGASGLVPPGTVLFSQTNKHETWMPHYGGFVGTDLELGYANWYVSGAMDYTWVTTQSYKLNSIETTFNPGGFGATISLGAHF
ncbi:MAG TPA: hypothetical protein VK463_20970, partial [Desulfomonilaceae bacterium]|nr:hypothetical protein [Desulfomonilaceae bacterium]